MDGYLASFHLLAIVNSAAMSIHIQVFEYFFQFFWYMPSSGNMEILCHMVILYFFSETAKLLSTVTVPVYIPNV